MIVNISYQTLHLPPPYAFAYTLDMEFGKELNVAFSLEYLNRDTMTEEEIISEGYTADDDFQWSGTLSDVWVKELKADLSDIDLTKPKDTDPIWIYVRNDYKEGNVSSLEEWDFRLQEVIQAIYEEAGKELLLKIKFIYISGSKSEFYELNGSFAERTCKVNKKKLAWQEMQSLLSKIFSLDFDTEPVTDPKEDDLWIDPDGQSGYQSVNKMVGKKGSKLVGCIVKTLK